MAKQSVSKVSVCIPVYNGSDYIAGSIESVVQIDKVKLLHGEGGLVVGQPVVAGATVTAEIIRQGRTRSITVFKKHRRKNYRRTRGHRQGFTQLRVTGIETK